MCIVFLNVFFHNFVCTVRDIAKDGIIFWKTQFRPALITLRRNKRKQLSVAACNPVGIYFFYPLGLPSLLSRYSSRILNLKYLHCSSVSCQWPCGNTWCKASYGVLVYHTWSVFSSFVECCFLCRATFHSYQRSKKEMSIAAVLRKVDNFVVSSCLSFR